jgi:hypothetical protein
MEQAKLDYSKKYILAEWHVKKCIRFYIEMKNDMAEVQVWSVNLSWKVCSFI